MRHRAFHEQRRHAAGPDDVEVVDAVRAAGETGDDRGPLRNRVRRAGPDPFALDQIPYETRSSIIGTARVVSPAVNRPGSARLRPSSRPQTALGDVRLHDARHIHHDPGPRRAVPSTATCVSPSPNSPSTAETGTTISGANTPTFRIDSADARPVGAAERLSFEEDGEEANPPGLAVRGTSLRRATGIVAERSGERISPGRLGEVHRDPQSRPARSHSDRQVGAAQGGDRLPASVTASGRSTGNAMGSIVTARQRRRIISAEFQPALAEIVAAQPALATRAAEPHQPGTDRRQPTPQ